VLGTVLVCSKFYNDIYYSNKDIATIAGVEHLELNEIELYILNTLGYSLYVSTEEFMHYEQGL
jgi:hypothetical protein